MSNWQDAEAYIQADDLAEKHIKSFNKKNCEKYGVMCLLNMFPYETTMSIDDVKYYEYYTKDENDKFILHRDVDEVDRAWEAPFDTPAVEIKVMDARVENNKLYILRLIEHWDDEYTEDIKWKKVELTTTIEKVELYEFPHWMFLYSALFNYTYETFSGTSDFLFRFYQLVKESKTKFNIQNITEEMINKKIKDGATKYDAYKWGWQTMQNNVLLGGTWAYMRMKAEKDTMFNGRYKDRVIYDGLAEKLLKHFDYFDPNKDLKWAL